MHKQQIKIDETTPAIEVLTQLAKSKGPVTVEFNFQCIRYQVESKLTGINGKQLQQ